MTTIATEAPTIQPTAGTEATSGHTSRTWRYVVAFVAGAAFTVAVGAGLSARTDDHSAAPSAPVSAAHASPEGQCPFQLGRPC